MTTNMTTKITKLLENRYSVVTDTRSDFWMALTGNVLKSKEGKGLIRTGGLLKITLGPISLAKVSALKINESATFTN